jgi:hypothetical protein
MELKEISCRVIDDHNDFITSIKKSQQTDHLVAIHELNYL